MISVLKEFFVVIFDRIVLIMKIFFLSLSFSLFTSIHLCEKTSYLEDVFIYTRIIHQHLTFQFFVKPSSGLC